MRVALLALLVACGGGDGGGGDAGGADAPRAVDSDLLPWDAAPDPLVGVGAVELVDDGYQFVEGPQWREASGDVVFSDIDGNTIYRYVPGGGAPTVLRTPSNNSNGLAVETDGSLLAAEHGSRSVTRTTGSGTTTVVDRYMGMRLNSPNDVITDLVDGTIYFTDPPYGIQPADRELAFNGVFRIDPGGTLHAEHMGALAERPNGIAIDPSHQRVYVADTADGNLYQFSILPDGALAPRVRLVETSGNPDGLALDVQGNLFIATATGIEVFGPEGNRWGVIPVPQQPANCAFGDADHRTLYITARSAVYKVRLAGPGAPRN